MPLLRVLTAVGLLTATAPLFAQPAADAGKPKPYAEKLLYAPTPVPDRVILTWNGDPATSQAVTWRTDPTVKVAVAQIAESEDGPDFDPIARTATPPAGKVTTVPATSTPLKTDLSEALYHSATFTGLKPATRYVYRVGDKLNWSEWHQFRTTSDKPEPVEFIYFGDAQNDVKRHWSRVVRGAYSDMPKAHFILHAGDLINVYNRDAEWGEWHAAAGWINGTVPSLPTPGNHEYGRRTLSDEEKKQEATLSVAGGTAAAPAKPLPLKGALTAHWKAQFTLPENGPAGMGLEESCYFVDVQGVRVISLNSNEKQQEQVAWLEQTLKDNPNRWTVVTFHHPVYATAASRQKEEQGKAVRQFWRPLLDQYGVDLVLQGHDHSYGRSGLMREDNLLSGTQAFTRKGTVYCVSVSGPKMYDLGEQPWMVSSGQKKQLYQLIRIDGGRLHYQARTAAGQLYDEFELRKQPNGVNKLVERADLDAERARGDSPAGLTGRDALFAVGGMGVLAAGMFGLRWLFRKRAA
jgi:3',5'-cyclic AMP phosphodiesterase CpdA